MVYAHVDIEVMTIFESDLTPYMHLAGMYPRIRMHANLVATHPLMNKAPYVEPQVVVK